MKLSNKKIKYIKRHALKISPEEIAKDLRIRLKDVQKVLKQLESKPQDSSTLTHTIRKNTDTASKFHLMAVCAICLLGIIIYSNTLNSPFTFDDRPNIEINPYLRITNFDFQPLYNAGFKSPNKKRPVANISFALNYYMGKYDVSGYHIVNIIIHLINGILVYFLSLIIFKQASDVQIRKISQFNSASIPLMSLFAALVFVTHPIQTQSVTYIVQRMNSMAAMFYLLSLLLYINSRLTRIRWKQWSLFCGCILSWIMALGSKEIAATLPLAILIYEWYFLQDLRFEWLRRNLKFFVGLFAILVLVVFVYLGENPFNRISGSYTNRDFTMPERVLTQFRVIVFYISLLLYPHPSRLNLHHHVITSTSLIEPITTFLSLAILLGLIGMAVYLVRRQRLISFCIFWFFLNLAIESSVIGLEMIFEHRLYLPMFGFSLIVSYLLFLFLSKRRWWPLVISIIIILSLSTATYMRNSVWSDEVTLWKDCVMKSPQQARPHNNLGTALDKQGRTEDAFGHYLQALRIAPDYEDAHYNLGTALNKQGRFEEAADHFLEVLRIDPGYKKAHNNLGNALDGQGRTQEAIGHYLQALRINPDFKEAHNNLGTALKKQGRIQEAIDQYLQALRIDPDYEKAHNNLGNALDGQGRTQEAIGHYLKALRINPDFEEAQYNLGNALDKQGHTEQAIESYLKALDVKPDYKEAHYNLGNALKKQGRTKEAIDHYLQVLRLDPDFEKAHYNLGTALEKEGRIKEAIDHYLEALRIKPDYVEAHNNLGAALEQRGRTKEAIGHYLEALRIDPGFEKAHYNLGIAREKEGRTKEALDHYLQALRIRPDFYDAHTNIGIIYAKQGRLDKALGHFRDAFQLNPDDVAMKNNLAKTHRDLGEKFRNGQNFKKAIAHFKAALRIKPDYLEVKNKLLITHNNYGALLGKQGHLTEAAIQFQEALRLDPNYTDAKNNFKKVLMLKHQNK